MTKAVNAGHPRNGAAQPIRCANSALPAPSPSSTQLVYASAARVTASRLATLNNQPRGCLGYRDTMSAPITAHPALARGASGQPWSAQVASLISGRCAAVNTVSRVIATAITATTPHATRALTSLHRRRPGATRARLVQPCGRRPP